MSSVTEANISTPSKQEAIAGHEQTNVQSELREGP